MSLLGSKRVFFSIVVMIFCFSHLSAQNEQNDEMFQDSLWQENEEIIQEWDISHNSIQIDHYKESHYHKLSFQNEFLQKVFQYQQMVPPIEEFDLERNPELVMSYIYLLQYITIFQ